MGVIQASTETKRIAEQSFNNNEVIKQADTFTVYRLLSNQKSMLDNFVLMLFAAGHDFPKDGVPDGLVIPVDVDSRRGYLLLESTAQSFQA